MIRFMHCTVPLWLVSVMLLPGCSATPSDHSSMMAYDAERKIIREASATITVDSPLQSGQQLASAIEQRKGVVYRQDGRADFVSIKGAVPSEDLDAFLATLPQYGEVERQDISQLDVTDQYTDQKAKLDNLSALRDRLRDLLDRAKDVKDVLAIERELTRVQGEIDQLEGQLQRLNQQVAMSPITLHLDQKRIYGPLGYLFKGIGWIGEKLFVIQ